MGYYDKKIKKRIPMGHMKIKFAGLNKFRK